MASETLPASLEEYQALIEEHGPTDAAYLKGHFERFIGTFRQFSEHWSPRQDSHVLDIGAHWLHQSVLFSRAGFRVTGADFPVTLELEGVRALAAANGIELLVYDEIATGGAFDSIADDSVDVVLFTEILEHITFNPVAFWEGLYRVLKVGARIVVTTPNFYNRGGRAWQWKRFLSGFGSGIDNLEILRTPTYGHHWKEYTRKEVCHYFCALSPDFHIHRALEVDSGFKEPQSFWQRRTRFLLPQLYVEIDLTSKEHGITMKPSW